ncbi:MAG: hypothetical protein ABR915_01730 [Thermoguttaceae bacterium]|jgi:hypothetical protein
MTTFDFELVLSPGTVLTDDMAEALFESGCDDGTVGACNQTVSILFSRRAESLESAIRSAVADVQKAGCTAAEVRLEAGAFAAV